MVHSCQLFRVDHLLARVTEVETLLALARQQILTSPRALREDTREKKKRNVEKSTHAKGYKNQPGRGS